MGCYCMVLAPRVPRKCSLPCAVRLEAPRERVTLPLAAGRSVGGISVVFRTPPEGLGLKVKCSGLKALKDSPLHVLEIRNRSN